MSLFSEYCVSQSFHCPLCLWLVMVIAAFEIPAQKIIVMAKHFGVACGDERHMSSKKNASASQIDFSRKFTY